MGNYIIWKKKMASAELFLFLHVYSVLTWSKYSELPVKNKDTIICQTILNIVRWVLLHKFIIMCQTYSIWIEQCRLLYYSVPFYLNVYIFFDNVKLFTFPHKVIFYCRNNCQNDKKMLIAIKKEPHMLQCNIKVFIK